MLHATVFDEHGNPLFAGIDLEVTLVRRVINGGDDYAEIVTSGHADALWKSLTWLGNTVQIYAANGAPAWRGRIVECTVPHAGQALGLSLRNMYNRVAVAYTVNKQRRTTAWVQDDDSVRRYGRQELLLSLAETTDEQAAAERDKRLADSSAPRRIQRGSSGETGLLVCEGLFHTLDAVYYANEKGRILRAANQSQIKLLAWGITSSMLIGVADKMIQSFGYDLDALARDMKVEITGTNPANGIYTVGGQPEGTEADQVTNTTIHFETDDDIYDDDGKALGFIKPGRAILISCTPVNAVDGYWLAETVERGWVSLELSWNGREMLLMHTPGTVNIKMAQAVKLADEVVPNFVMDPSRPTTLRTLGSSGIADAFVLNTSAGWDIAEVVLELRRIGDPPDITVTLHANAAGVPGTTLGTATISADDVTDAFSKLSAVFSPLVAVVPSTTYWIKLAPATATYSPTDYYEIKTGVEDVTGDLVQRTSTTWVKPDPEEFLVYEIWGNVQTTEQIQDIAEQEGDLLSAVDVRIDSGINTRQYRDGDRTAWSEIQRLLDAYTADDTPLMAEVTGSTLVVRAMPTKEESYLLYNDGKLFNKVGAALPEGILPVGEWVYIDVPEEINEIVGLSPYQIQAAEWAQGAIRLDPVRLNNTRDG